MFRRCYIINDFSTLDQIAIDYKSFMEVTFRNMCFYPKKNHHTYIGSYKNSNTTNFADNENTIKRHFYSNSELDNISLNELKHLILIEELCKKNDIKLILVTTPLSRMYFSKVPKEFLLKMNELKCYFESNDILLLDYSYTEFKENEFLNSDHLNAKGAKRFSKELYDDLHENK